MTKHFKIFLIIYLIICLVTISIFCLSIFSLHPKLKRMCLDIGGEYRFFYNECQTTDASLGRDFFSLCNSVKGEFNSCASPCRHSHTQNLCGKTCEVVCKF